MVPGFVDLVQKRLLAEESAPWPVELIVKGSMSAVELESGLALSQLALVLLEIPQLAQPNVLAAAAVIPQEH